MRGNTTVWLIEDSDVYRRGLSRAIDRAPGLLCTGRFGSAEEALGALAPDNAPDVILLDIGLPGMDGLDALGEFRRRIPDTRVVLLTVFEDPDKIFRAICAGANGYLLKTGSTATVVEAIQHAAAGGAPMTPAIAARVLSLFARIAGAPAQGRSEYGLTVREKEVLELLAEGLVAKEIAARLGISLHTVTNHQRSIYAKLHVGTNTGAVAKAIRERLI